MDDDRQPVKNLSYRSDMRVLGIGNNSSKTLLDTGICEGQEQRDF